MKTKKLGGGSEAGVGPGVSRRRFLRTTGILAGAGALIFASFEFGIKRVIQMARAPVAKKWLTPRKTVRTGDGDNDGFA